MKNGNDLVVSMEVVLVHPSGEEELGYFVGEGSTIRRGHFICNMVSAELSMKKQICSSMDGRKDVQHQVD